MAGDGGRLMKGRWPGWAMLGMLVALALGGPASAAIIDGTYGAPCISPNTGDEGGMIVEVHAAATPPYVLFNLCEGWCYDPIRTVAHIEGQRIAFDIVDHMTDSAGRPLEPETTHYAGEFRRRALTISGSGAYSVAATTLRLDEKMRRCPKIRG